MAVSLKSKHDAGPRNVEQQTDGTFRETVSLYGYGADYGDTAIRVDASTGALLIIGPNADDAAFTPGTSKVFPMGAFADETGPDSVNEGDIGAPRMSLNRILFGTLRDAAGNERGANVTAANELNVLDSNSAAALTALQLIDDAVIADDAAFTPATTKTHIAGFFADETATDSVDEGDAGAARMTLDRKQIVAQYAHAAGGATAYNALSTAAVLTAELKGSAGTIYGFQAFNNGANEVFARLYNQTGAPGTGDGANIVWQGMIPGNAAGAGFSVQFPLGIACATGIGIRVSGAVATTDTTVLAANEVQCNVQYK